MTKCKHLRINRQPNMLLGHVDSCADCGIALRNQDERLEDVEIVEVNPATCKHENIEKRPARQLIRQGGKADIRRVATDVFEFECKDCGLMGDSEDDIRGEGSIEARVAEESDERSERARLLTELGQTLAQTPEELFALMDEKMFRQIMKGYVTIKLRPHQKLIGYYILSIQDREVAFVPDPEEGCRFAAAMMLKAANAIPKLRQYDEDEQRTRSMSNGNGLIKIVH